jgi:hypothetical protein
MPRMDQLPGSAGPGKWFWGVGEQKNGPISLQDLQGMVRAGQLGPHAMVWTDGMPNWVPAGKLPILFPQQAMSRGEENALNLLVPIGPQSGLSIAAGYCALVGLLIPPCALVGLLLGIFGVRDLKRHPEKHGWGRALTGIIGGGLFTLGWTLLFLSAVFTHR